VNIVRTCSVKLAGKIVDRQLGRCIDRRSERCIDRHSIESSIDIPLNHRSTLFTDQHARVEILDLVIDNLDMRELVDYCYCLSSCASNKHLMHLYHYNPDFLNRNPRSSNHPSIKQLSAKLNNCLVQLVYCFIYCFAIFIYCFKPISLA